MNRQGFLKTGLMLLFLSALFVPVAGALTQSMGQPGSQSYVIQENVKIISPLRMHIAYVGRTQQARMDGVITYIDGISGGTGTTGLRQIQEDYLTAAFPVPMMHTAEEITAARGEMQRQSILFVDETNIQMVKFNGNFTDLRSSTEAAMNPVEESYSCLRYSAWLASQTTRSSVFNQSSERRMAILEDLSLHGLDVSYPKNLAAQIDEQQAELNNALLQNRDGVLLSINSGLKVLKQQFRSTVEVYRMDLQAQLKAAEWSP